MVGVIMVAEVITMDGVEAEATITDGGTIIAAGGDTPLGVSRPDQTCPYRHASAVQAPAKACR